LGTSSCILCQNSAGLCLSRLLSHLGVHPPIPGKGSSGSPRDGRQRGRQMRLDFDRDVTFDETDDRGNGGKDGAVAGPPLALDQTKHHRHDRRGCAILWGDRFLRLPAAPDPADPLLRSNRDGDDGQGFESVLSLSSTSGHLPEDHSPVASVPLAGEERVCVE
jgi:hypothetical protein